jgi:hypothetical protein
VHLEIFWMLVVGSVGCGRGWWVLS